MRRTKATRSLQRKVWSMPKRWRILCSPTEHSRSHLQMSRNGLLQCGRRPERRRDRRLSRSKMPVFQCGYTLCWCNWTPAKLIIWHRSSWRKSSLKKWHEHVRILTAIDTREQRYAYRERDSQISESNQLTASPITISLFDSSLLLWNWNGKGMMCWSLDTKPC